MLKAGVDLTVNGRKRKKGQPVPEAEGWPSRQQLVNAGLLIEVKGEPRRSKKG